MARNSSPPRSSKIPPSWITAASVSSRGAQSPANTCSPTSATPTSPATPPTPPAKSRISTGHGRYTNPTRRSQIENTPPQRNHNGMSTIGRSELRQDVLHVCFDGALGNFELCRDELVGLSLRHTP